MDYSSLIDKIVVVTGGAGFIGSHICEELLKIGAYVRCLDNLSYGSIRNISEFIGNDKFSFINGDIFNLDTCMSVCTGADYIIHEAGFMSVPKSIAEPLICYSVNVLGILNMLESARLCGVKTFIYATSSVLYDDKIGSLYASSKLACEELAYQYSLHYRIKTYGLRYFNVYGNRQVNSMVIPKFIETLKAGNQVTMYGDGGQVKDFVYVKDIAKANILCCLHSNSEKNQPGELSNYGIYDIGSGKGISLLEMYRILCQELSISDREPIYLENRVGDVKYVKANIKLSFDILGYKPDWDFKSGIADMLN